MSITSARYVEMYNQKRKASDVSRMFIPLNQRDFTHMRHRTVWATWELHVKALNHTTRAMSNAFALFDTSPTPEELAEELDSAFALDEVTYLEVVRIELMEEASLMQEFQSDDGQLSFGMHRTIREFVSLRVGRKKSCLKILTSELSCLFIIVLVGH